MAIDRNKICGDIEIMDEETKVIPEEVRGNNQLCIIICFENQILQGHPE